MKKLFLYRDKLYQGEQETIQDYLSLRRDPWGTEVVLTPIEPIEVTQETLQSLKELKAKIEVKEEELKNLCDSFHQAIVLKK